MGVLTIKDNRKIGYFHQPIFTGDQEEKPNLVGEEPSLFLKVQK